MAAIAAVLVWAPAAMAVTFDVEVLVGFNGATATCSSGPSSCLAFSGTGGLTGTSTRATWDASTTGPDSHLAIGALPDVNGFPAGNPPVPDPLGSGTTTISDDGAPLRTVQINHYNNVINDADRDLATVEVQSLLTLSNGAFVLEIPFNITTSFLETTNTGPADGSGCVQTSNALGSRCDDEFTFVDLAADIPFVFNGQNFVLNVQGLVFADGSPACIDEGGGAQSCLTREAEINERFVVISLTSEQVTVPAPGALLLLGMGLVGVVIRKRMSA
jgi:hypothetical protein